MTPYRGWEIDTKKKNLLQNLSNMLFEYYDMINIMVLRDVYGMCKTILEKDLHLKSRNDYYFL